MHKTPIQGQNLVLLKSAYCLSTRNLLMRLFFLLHKQTKDNIDKTASVSLEPVDRRERDSFVGVCLQQFNLMFLIIGYPCTWAWLAFPKSHTVCRLKRAAQIKIFCYTPWMVYLWSRNQGHSAQSIMKDEGGKKTAQSLRNTRKCFRVISCKADFFVH